ncbi:MAG: ECF transporter S component [Muribaculaceae bacterium]|nr:ECF transporter S component [Muribaculaceae bacterium]
MQTAINLQSLQFKNYRTYVAATLFVIGNLLLPQLFHAVPRGGMIWLPIYFFTLVGAYRFGWRVGLLTALASPMLSSLIFGMPAVAALPAITLKSALLAGIAGFAAHRFNRVNIGILLAVVLGYQTLGTLGEWAIVGDLSLALQDFRIGIPGMILQVIGGYLVISRIK